MESVRYRSHREHLTRCRRPRPPTFPPIIAAAVVLEGIFQKDIEQNVAAAKDESGVLAQVIRATTGVSLDNIGTLRAGGQAQLRGQQNRLVFRRHLPLVTAGVSGNSQVFRSTDLKGR